MTSADVLTGSLMSARANEDFTEAVLRLEDGSRLCFCHRVGERWAKAVGADECPEEGGMAEELLAAIALFRLNAKHLDIQFQDGSRWDQAVPRIE
jgi:hypothetical protein